MKKIDMSRYHKPGLNRTDNVKYDLMRVKMLDKYQWNHNLFVLYELGDN